MSRAKVRAKGQVTLPRDVREALRISEGDDIEFVMTDEGVFMRGLKTIPADQAWFWTPEWQTGEREADEQIAAGLGTVYYSAEEFLASLDD